MLDLLADSVLSFKTLIIKVPSAKGILFNLALTFTRITGYTRMLHRLLQLDSPPHHYTYFTPKGLTLLLSKYGYKLDKLLYDSDFELASFADRLIPRSPLRVILSLLSLIPLAFFCLFLPKLKDSFILKTTKKKRPFHS